MAAVSGRWQRLGLSNIVALAVLAGSAGALLVTGCGGGGGGGGGSAAPKPKITSVQGDGATSDRIQAAIIVRGSDFKSGDTVEVRDSVGVPITSGVGTTTFVAATQLRLAVSPAAFPVATLRRSTWKRPSTPGTTRAMRSGFPTTERQVAGTSATEPRGAPNSRCMLPR